ncbi:carbohydrate-binding domain-containing protein [Candidatus Saccharibacteria bacterium]|nr:carbohydrate-binding domain-containing protein [Candidatus Saccharibacteria bacterium]
MKKQTLAAIIGGVVLAIGVAGAGTYLIIKNNTAEQTTIVSSDSSSSSGSTTLAEGKNKITSGGTYTFTGSISSGKITVDTTEAVTIILDNVSISSSDGAAIKCQADSNVTIKLVGDNKITATNENDGINSEGDLTITGDGSLTISAADDGIHADGKLTIESGNITITGAEGLEATYVKIDGGTINITASDDGINAAAKSDKYSVLVEINGGDITINMGQGDTDAIDSNDNIIINGGTVNITGQSAFDYDGTATLNGGKLIVNGTETTSITNQFMGGGMMGGMMGGGQMPTEGTTPTEGTAPSGETAPSGTAPSNGSTSGQQRQNRTRTTTTQ